VKLNNNHKFLTASFSVIANPLHRGSNFCHFSLTTKQDQVLYQMDHIPWDQITLYDVRSKMDIKLLANSHCVNV